MAFYQFVDYKNKEVKMFLKFDSRISLKLKPLNEHHRSLGILAISTMGFSALKLRLFHEIKIQRLRYG